MCGRRGEIASKSIVSSSSLKSGEASPHLSVIPGVSSRCAEKSCGRHFECMSGEVSGSAATQKRKAMKDSRRASEISNPFGGKKPGFEVNMGGRGISRRFPHGYPSGSKAANGMWPGKVDKLGTGVFPPELT